MISNTRGHDRQARRFVVGVILAVSCAVALAAAQRPQPQVLGGADGRPSKERCDAIEIERARLAFQIVDTQEQLDTTRNVEERGRLQQALNKVLAQDEGLKREQIACSNGPLTGQVTSGQSGLPGAPPPPGGGSPIGLPGAPGASAPPVATGAGAAAGTTLAAGSTANRGGMSKELAATLCKEKKAGINGKGGLDDLRAQAPATRLKIASLRDELSRVAMMPDQRAAKEKELADLQREQTYIAGQISILEESMQSIPGCDPATGTIREPAPATATNAGVPAGLAGTSRTPNTPGTPPTPPGPVAPATPVSGPREPTFVFAGIWRVTTLDAPIVGTLRLTATSQAPSGVRCDTPTGSPATADSRRFFSGRLEFANDRRTWDEIRFGGHVLWGALVALGPPAPAVLEGCVTGSTLEATLHPENGPSPAGVLKLRGLNEGNSIAEGNLNFGQVGHHGLYRWRLTRQ